MSSLLSRNPPGAITLDPKPPSIVVVMLNALPSASTMEIWEVDGISGDQPGAHSGIASSAACSQGGEPADTSGSESSPDRSSARDAMYAASSRFGMGT